MFALVTKAARAVMYRYTPGIFSMARRRRVYVFDLAAILADHPPPNKKVWPSMLMAALVGALGDSMVVVGRGIIEVTPASKLEAVGIFLVAYALIMMIFGAIAVRVRQRHL